ncbi:hypothetical protein [Streptomyces osmaniensis]|uniref:Uncharacterized protein n=1 Tax=Streptomyces osmaniensis TaxID=593134 RepID=A0ABP6V2I4_9ACTN|nr:hypothetical protein KJK32_16695 [Streptomyces sp. JCM17656]
MDNTTVTETAATPNAADPAPHYALVALDEIRTWRHRQPHADAPRYAELDAILDAAALGRIERRLDLPEPTSLPEAVAAHHAVLDLRRRILADAGRAWDLVEARVIRQIARFMPGAESEA